MPWTTENSRNRVTRIADSIPEIVISDLAREMTLENVKLATPKRITGVHSYIALANEQRLVDELLDVDDQDAAKRVARRLHLYQRATGHTADVFGAARIHFQGSRLHSLTYRPFSDHAEIAARTVAMALAVDLVVRRALNPALKDDPDLGVAAGAAYGESLATMSGSRGDSELLFIGDSANDGAKAIDLSCRLRVTADLLDLLDCDDLGIDATEHPDGRYALAMTQDAIEDLAKRCGIGWTLDTATKKVNNDVEAITLDSVGIRRPPRSSRSVCPWRTASSTRPSPFSATSTASPPSWPQRWATMSGSPASCATSTSSAPSCATSPSATAAPPSACNTRVIDSSCCATSRTTTPRSARSRR